MLSRIADKLVMRPTRHAIEAETKSRRWVGISSGRFEAWIEQTGDDPSRDADLFVLKFPGTGGRAERATTHPAECWPDLCAEVWAVNPPGYGGSRGRASLHHLAETATAAFNAIERVAAGRPIVVTGNSLGTASALRVAAEHKVAGLILRNPPPLRELIFGRYGWWNFNLAARLIANQIPHELDSVANAAKSPAPAVLLSSGKDSVVPPSFQQLVFDSYHGPARRLTLPEADHACPLNESEQQQYSELLHWLRSHITPLVADAAGIGKTPHVADIASIGKTPHVADIASIGKTPRNG